MTQMAKCNPIPKNINGRILNDTSSSVLLTFINSLNLIHKYNTDRCRKQPIENFSLRLKQCPQKVVYAKSFAFD